MSLKTRLVSLISAFALILTMLIMGVLAVSQVNVNMGGNISFTADDVYAHVTGSVTGATVPPSALDVTYSATKTTGDDTVWEELKLNFNTSATPLVFSITVENLSTERTLTVTLTDTILAETPNLLKTITTTSGAYTSGDIITLDPQGQANDTVQFTLTLSVEDKNTSLSNASFSYDLQLFDASVAPEPPEITGFTFTTSDADATATLTDYTGSEANVVIPSTFSILDGKYVEGSDYTVTAIVDGTSSTGAFAQNENLQSITLPETLETIGSYAFYMCSALTEVNFGEDSQLKSIGNSAFGGCNNLTSITIPEDVISIGGGAFGSCYALAEVYNYSSRTIDYNATSNGLLGYYAEVIYNASALTGEKPATKIDVYDNVQYYVDGTTRIALAPAVPRKSLISVTLHTKTTEINQRAFYECLNLASITIPSSVTSIGDEAFSWCTRLTSITIPSSVKSINGNYTFTGCKSLATVTIDSGDIYNDVTSETACGGLIDYATTIRVLASIIDGGSYTSSYLNATNFLVSGNAVDGYYLFI